MRQLIARDQQHKYTLSFEPAASPEEESGWLFIKWTVESSGAEVMVLDFWDATVRELLPTIAHHAPGELSWRDVDSGQTFATADLPSLDAA